MLHTFFVRISLLVAATMLVFGVSALLAICSKTLYSLRATSLRHVAPDPFLLFLLWRCLLDVGESDYSSAVFWVVMYLFLFRKMAPNLRPSPSYRELAAEAVLLLSCGSFCVLASLGLVQRVLGPVAALLLKPYILIPVSFGMLVLLVWRAFRETPSSPVEPHAPIATLR